jgi:hypothetical protein
MIRQGDVRQSALFGPVRSMTLFDIDANVGVAALDLDEGAGSFRPANWPDWSESEGLRWAQSKGIDLMLDYSGDRWALITPDTGGLHMARVQDRLWDSSPTYLEDTLRASPSPGLEVENRALWRAYKLPETPAHVALKTPITLAVASADKRLGLLQITDCILDPKALTLRWKFLRNQQSWTPEPGRIEYPLSGPFIARLPQGEIELVAVSRHPSEHKPWWTADGLPFPWKTLFTWGSHSSSNRDQMAREFVFRLSGLPADASWPTWQLDPPASWAGGRVGYEPNQGSPELKMISATLPSSARSVTVRVGVGMGPWETVAEQEARSSGMSSTSRHGQNWTVSFTRTGELEGNARITVVHTVMDWNVRVVAVNTDNVEQSTHDTESTGTDPFSETTATFTGLPLAKVKAFRFQVRPYCWVEFRNVSLNPGHQSWVGVVHAASAAQYTPPPAGLGSSSQTPSFRPVIERMELDLDGETMQNIVAALRQKYPIRLCLENLDFDKQRDGITIEQTIAQLEGTAQSRPLRDKENRRLAIARQLLQEGSSKDSLFDVGPRFEGRIVAETVDGFLTQLTQDTPYDWRRIDDTYVVCPRGQSRLMFPVTLKTDGLTVEQAVTRVLDQDPSGSKMGLSVTVAMPVKEIGEDPCPWLRAKAPSLDMHEVPAMTALCRITAGARPDLVWGLYGYRDGRHLGLAPVSKPK